MSLVATGPSAELSSPTRARVVRLAAFTLPLLLALWIVPYHVPVKPSVSLSYAFGFSNRAAEALVGLWMAAIALWGMGVVRDKPAPAKPLTRSTLKKALAITFAVSFTLYLATRSLNGFGESIYLIDRVWHAVAGQIPYRDFEFAYGAGFLYGPWVLCRLLHLRLGDAYGLFFVAVSLAGVALVYKTLKWLGEPAAPLRTIFLFLCALAIPGLLSTGVNYSLLRFVLPGALGVLFFRQMERRAGSSGIGPALLLAVPYAAAVLLVSPELSVAFAVGAAIFALWMAWRERVATDAAWCAAMLAALALLMAAAWKLGVFVTLVGFSAGGYNLPIVPSAYLLVFLAGLGLAALYAGQQFRQGQPTAVLMLIATSVAALPAAMGRYDPTHMILAPFGISIAALLIASRWRLMWRVFFPAAVLVYVILPLPGMLKAEATVMGKAAMPALLAHEQPNQTTALDRFLMKQMTAQLGPEKAAEKFADVKMLAHRNQVDVPRTYGLRPGQLAEVPFGFTPTRFAIDHSPATDPGYFSGSMNVVSVEEVAAKVNELRAHPDRPLLLLRHAETSCGFNQPDDQALIRGLDLVPYHANERNPRNPLEQLCTYIQKNYTLAEPATPEHFGYALWQPK